MRSAAISQLERCVMEKLLAGDGPVLSALRAQFEMSHVRRRELTGAGFFTSFDVPSTAVRANLEGRIRIRDVEAVIEGLQYGAGFILLVTGGVIEMLEGYSYEEPWPAHIGSFTLRYHKTPRDLSFVGLR